LRRTKVSRIGSAHDKGYELVREAIKLREVSPAETLKIVSELTEFALKINKAARNHAEKKDH
jgi:hypothetical protein